MEQNLNLKEMTLHGTPMFPLMHYRCTIPDTCSQLPMHWHDEMEIAMIREGSATYHIDLQSYEISRGDIILLPPHTLHGVSQIVDHTMSSDSYVFHLNLLGYGSADVCSIHYLQPVYTHEFHVPFIISPQTEGYEELADCFFLIRQCDQTREFPYELKLKSLLLDFFHLLFHHNIIQPEVCSRDNLEITGKIKTILQYIQESYMEQITISTLASLCHFSEYHFMRFFKKYVGITCIEYINHCRLNKAARLLKEGDLPVSTIALETGFNNISYFNRQFRQKFQMTPGEYRRLP